MDEHIATETEAHAEATGTAEENRSSLSFEETGKEIEKKLSARPTQDDLLERNVIKHNEQVAAPALHAAMVNLERERTMDTLNEELQHRCTKEELVERNIIREKEGLAP